MKKFVLGISAYYHDSAAALLGDGVVIAAAHEERFTRLKHDPSFPVNAVKYVLAEAGIEVGDLQSVVFYDKPFLKFERLLETYHAFVPRGLKSFLLSMPVWLKEKIFLKKILKDELAKIGGLKKVPILFAEHHLSHAASAFYPSPFAAAAILTIDAIGEWATASICYGEGKTIKILKELDFPHSIGMLYSAFTYYTGFKVNSGEYKMMGLAPYGNPQSAQVEEFKNKILDKLVDIRADGSIVLNMDYFDYGAGLKMSNDKKWQELFGLPPRSAESELTSPYMNLALAIQRVTEEIVLRLARTAKELTGSDYLVLAGGVALNSVANGILLQENIFKDIWIQPAAGDAGGALGAAYAGWHISANAERNFVPGVDAMQGAYLGPEFGNKEILQTAEKYGAKYENFADFQKLIEKTAGLLAAGKVVGWFQGRMEYGPRALGDRSILGDARNPEMQKKINLKIKYREGFRPFAPSVLEEDAGDFFEIDRPSPYMLLVVPLNKERRKPLPAGYDEMELYKRLYTLRSDIPAVTHIDYSGRIQTVSQKTNPRYWQLINEFKKQTGYGVIINTSFNVRGEPIVCTPEDAYKCFMHTEMDYLVMGDVFFDKAGQPPLPKEEGREYTD